jgi:hypothetical protein
MPKLRVAWAIGLAMLVLGPATTASAAAPKLTGLSVPGSGHAGDDLKVKAKVKNGSKKRVKVKVTATLVPQVEGAAITLRSVKTKALRARKTTAVTVSLRVPATVAVGTYRLRVCIGKSCRTSGAVKVLDGSADARIEADLAAGKLPVGKAALYEYWAITANTKLPSKYRGTAPGDADTPMIGLEHWSSLSAGDRAAIEPYILPPSDSHSYWTPHSKAKAVRSLSPAEPADCTPTTPVPAGNWIGAPATNPVVVWASNAADVGLSKQLANAIDTKIWPRLIGTDGFPNPASDLPCDARGDGRLDVFIVPQSVMPDAWGLFQAESCGPAGGFILISKSANPPATILAHEFFHAEEAATGALCQNEAWTEGAAHFGADDVYPKDAYVHRFTRLSTSSFSRPLPNQDYHAWPFWYWLKQQAGVSAITQLFTSIPADGFNQAVHLATSGGDFTQAYRDFAVELWNQKPVGESGFPPDSFAQWDSYTAVPNPVQQTLRLGQAIGGPDKDTYGWNLLSQPYSIWYRSLTISGGVGQLTVKNGFEAADVGLDLLADTDDGWKRIDLSKEPDKTFCFDQPGEHIAHAILVLANAGSSTVQKTITARVDPRCDPTVTFSGQTNSCTTSCPGGKITYTWSGQAVLKVDNSGLGAGDGVQIYNLKSGSVSIAIHQVDADGCVGDGSTDLTLDPSLDSVDVVLQDMPTPTYSFNVGVLPNTITVTYSGCTDPPAPVQLPSNVASLGTTNGNWPRDPALTTIPGTYDSPPAADTSTTHYDWTINL